MDFKKVIRNIPDFPEKGVLFRDITPVLQNPQALNQAIKTIVNELSNLEFDYIVGPESRGFIFGMPAAYELNKGFIPIRKAGKLPAETISKSYDLEYGKATIEIHKDALKKGDRVVVVDDLLATGGTCAAIAELVNEIGAVIVNMSFFIELEDLKGREILKDYNITSVVKY